MTFFGLKWGQDLEKRAAHPHQELPGVPTPRERAIICRSLGPEFLLLSLVVL